MRVDSEWGGDEKSITVVMRSWGGLRSRAGVKGLLLLQTRVEVRFRCEEGTRGQLREFMPVDSLYRRRVDWFICRGLGLWVAMKLT